MVQTVQIYVLEQFLEKAVVQTVKTVWVFPQLQFFDGRRHPCHGAQADSHGPVQKTREILLQYIDKVIDGVVVQVQQIRALVWCHCTSRCVPSWFPGPDALHHGRYAPPGAVCGAVLNTAEIPQLQIIVVVYTPCRCAEFIPWSRQFVRPGIPQLLHIVVDALVVQVEQVHFSVVAQWKVPWSKLFV